MVEVKIRTEYITLGQFLKYVGIITDGYMAKIFLSENKIEVNGENENRRGKKLFPGSVIKVQDKTYLIK